MFDLDGTAIAGRSIEADAKAHPWRISAAAKLVTCDLHSCSASRAAARGPSAAPRARACLTDLGAGGGEDGRHD